MAVIATIALGGDEEEFYARDVDGRLIRTDLATHEELGQEVSLKVDGADVTIWRAVPWLDDQGRVKLDGDGKLLPRRATLYDAIAKHYSSGRDLAGPSPSESGPACPVLCHQEHLEPVAVCRVCSVLVSQNGIAEPKLAPACKQPVRRGMEVHTRFSRELVTLPGAPAAESAGECVGRAVRQIVELIALDHLHDKKGDSHPYENELLKVADALGIEQADRRPDASRAPFDWLKIVSHLPKVHRPAPELSDQSSPVIVFDRTSCILCDRCVRSCREVKPFKVISHTGRGHDARITFDLDDPMGESSCVSCGECAISCPTGALSFRGTVYQDRDPWRGQKPKPHTVKADELHQHPLFAGIPYAFLKWNEGAVGRLKLDAGHVLCERGDFGATAFLIEEGALDIDRGGGLPTITTTNLGILIGEMACINNGPRNATISAKGSGSVLVVRRNMLHMLRRNKNSRDMLDRAYSTRTLENWMLGGTLFDGFAPEQRQKQLEILRAMPAEVKFVRVDPRETFIEQGERADCVYVLLSGRVEVSQATSSGDAQVRAHLSPGRSFGEIGVISSISMRVAAALPESARGRRTAACRSLDHVELIRVSQQAILALIEHDETLLPELEKRCLAWIAGNRADSDLMKGHLRNEFSRQGLYEGQNLLVIDLEKCTRCLECVKACSDSHQGHSRLMFDGERFDKYLVPEACRSCHDPECLNGCPVDAIHRRPPAQSRSGHPTLAVFIEDHCIGCGLCAHNCPFESIKMHDLPHAKGAASRPPGAASRVARNCDLCESLDGVPRCVYACPHGAADRPAQDRITDRLQLNIL